MNGSSIWAILVLVIACVVTLLTLLTEKKEAEEPRTWIGKHRKLLLYILTVAVTAGGIQQIIKADKEARKAEEDHGKEHQVDQQKISGLQESVTTLGSVNQTQYERNQAVLKGLQDEVMKLKLGKLTAEDRERIANLEAELKAAMEPKPKAKLDFGFAKANIQRDEQPPKTKYITSDGGAIKVVFLTKNVSEVDATGVSIWLRICDLCKYHSEPANSMKPANSPESDRLYKVQDIPAGVFLGEIAADIEVPREVTRVAVSFMYRCADCIIENDMQTLWIDVGQIPIPKFSTPAPTSKKPIKPESFR